MPASEVVILHLPETLAFLVQAEAELHDRTLGGQVLAILHAWGAAQERDPGPRDAPPEALWDLENDQPGPAPQGTPQEPPGALDRRVFYLGRLCDQKHDYNATGRSQRYRRGGACRACTRERHTERWRTP